MDVRVIGEGRTLYACVIVRTSVHTIHSKSFTMFTAATVLHNYHQRLSQTGTKSKKIILKLINEKSWNFVVEMLGPCLYSLCIWLSQDEENVRSCLSCKVRNRY